MIAVAQKAADVDSVDPAARPSRGDVHQWRSPEGQPYWYRIPKKVSKSDPPNLLIMLHGTGGSEGWSFWNYPIAAGQFRPDDIVVSPDGVTPGANGTFNFVQGKDDGEQIASIIGVFRKSFPVGRVYLYGHSQGAFFCYWFAGAHPDLVDGIIAHAGNVLSVKHSKASREGVAIGILHGEADAVVPVECAHRTEKIYREEGYVHVRKSIVQGLTERSGHWPLPGAVGELLTWLDEVTETSPQKALDGAWAAAAATTGVPDLAAIRRRLDGAKSLAKRKRRGAKPLDASFDTRLGTLDAFVSAGADAHREGLGPIAAADGKSYGAVAVHFRIAHAAFAGRREWDSKMSALVKLAKKHEKSCAKLLASLEDPTPKRVRSAIKKAGACYLGAAYPMVLKRMEELAGGKDLDADAREALQSFLATRTDVEAAGSKAHAAVVEAFAKTRAAAFPDLVPDDDDSGGR